jgi:hypothetical protein
MMNVFLLSVANNYRVCHYAEYRCAECRGAIETALLSKVGLGYEVSDKIRSLGSLGTLKSATVFTFLNILSMYNVLYYIHITV